MTLFTVIIMTTDLSVPSEVLRGITPLQRYVMEILNKGDPKTGKTFSLDEIILSIAKISRTAMKSTPLGDEIEDPVARMNASKLLLELMGVYKKGGGNINMSFDLGDLLYNKAGNNDIPAAPQVIRQGE